MFLLLPFALAAAPPPIVNGEEAPGYSGVALLFMTNEEGEYGGTCTGSLVANKWVLTAAHCVVSEGWYRVAHVYVIFADNWEDASGSNTLEATSWTAHLDYDAATSENDLAMVELPSTIGAPVVELASESPTEADKGEDVRLVGYGSVSDYDYNKNPTRRLADVPLYDFDDHLLYTFDSDDDQNACYGDSGGPLLRLYPDGTYALAGVIDFVSGCNGGGLGASRTDRAINWIGEFTAGYSVHEAAEPEVDDHGSEDTGADDIQPAILCSTSPAASSAGFAVLSALAMVRRRRAQSA